MKLNRILTRLAEIKLWLEDEERQLQLPYTEYTGFFPLMLPGDQFIALSKGYWSSFFFAGITDGVGVGLRVMPDRGYETWPVHRNTDGEDAYTISNSIATFIPFCQARILMWTYAFPRVSRDWDVLMRLLSPMLELFDGVSQMDFIRAYASDPANMPESDDEYDNESRYLQFWNQYDTSYGHNIMRETINRLQEDMEWLPEEMPAGDLGNWATRILNMLMSRAEIESAVHDPEKVMQLIVSGFLQPHGYDVEERVFNHFPTSLTSKNAVHAVINYFRNNEASLPEDFAGTHLHEAANKIMGPGMNTYTGNEHYLAAMDLDAQQKPLEAWNALVSASYWAGVNGRPDLVEKHWLYAIGLCEKQGWTDAHEALTVQWDWYQDYKATQQ